MDTFTEALATARQMQQDWLSYGVNFIHLYIEDVEGDWLENWEHEELFCNAVFDRIKEYLVSDDAVAVRLRQDLGDRSLFDIAVNLEEIWRITSPNNRLTAVKSLLGDDESSDLAEKLLARLIAILVSNKS
nr:hypothetical protein [Anabaena sp. 4-3]